MAKRMTSEQERADRAARAERLVTARKMAGFGGVKSASAAFGWNVNSYKAHESGQNDFKFPTAQEYAKAYNVSAVWLMLGTGSPEDKDASPTAEITDVPLVSMVSAGQMTEHESVTEFQDFPTVPAVDLPDGQWIALRVTGDSMNKISPPDSIIFVNLRDRRLVANACYIVADETGRTTYKRYRPTETPVFQPASYFEVDPPCLTGAIRVIGRVRRSVIDL